MTNLFPHLECAGSNKMIAAVRSDIFEGQKSNYIPRYWRIDGILFIAKMKGGGGESPAGLTQIRTSAAAESQIERSHMVMMAEFKERNLHVCRYPSSATRTYIIF